MKLKLSLLLLMAGSASAADLSGVKTYLSNSIATQLEGTSALKTAAGQYYDIAKAANFDYKKVAANPKTRAVLQAARAGWSKASPVYENIEGIVAGVEKLSEFDVILDAGTSEGEDAVPFDLKLPNGKALPKPGNLFGVNESSLWGTFPQFTTGIAFDVNGNGKMDFGDKLPDANVLKAAADTLDSESRRLQKAAAEWQPTQEDVFGALAGNIPTVGPVFFEDWKTSPFVLGAKSKRRDFVVISRMNDLKGNIASWQAMYKGLSPDVKAKNAALDSQITAGLSDLAAYTNKLIEREKTRRYTPEQAEQLQRDAQNRATSVTGKITQAAALLGVKLQ